MLYIIGSGQTQGFRRTSLHPLGSADDHAYVINDAGISTLIIDPYFTERALQLLEKCPGLTQVLTIQEAVAGFGNDVVITIAGLFLLVGGLIRTGIVDLIGRRLHKIAGDNIFVLTALIMSTAAVSASVLKNTTTNTTKAGAPSNRLTS